MMDPTTNSDVESNETLKSVITKNTSVYIKSVDSSVPLSDPVYAINWFNTSYLWLYNFYNLLASVSVRKVGGIPFFKGRVQQIIQGNNDLQRDVLLIVNYPAASHFLRMMKSIYFLVVSIIRLIAVKQFTFGFTHRTDSRTIIPDNNKSKIYAIHHYRAKQDITPRLEEVARQQNIEVYYAGKISSLLYSGNRQQITEQIPCLMDGLIILRAHNAELIHDLIRQEQYQTVINQTESSFVAIMNRIL